MLGENHLDIAQSFKYLAGLYQDMREHEEAKRMLQKSSAIEKQTYQKEPKDIISRNNKIVNYKLKGEHASALPLSRFVLETTEHLLGKDHLDVAICLNNLASLYISSQNDYVSARLLYKRALKIRKRTLGIDSPYTAQSLRNLAKLHYIQK